MDSLFSLVYLVTSTPRWYLWSLFILGLITYYLCEVVKKPLLVTADGDFKKFLIESVPLVSEKFWPTIWCFESRAQTLLAGILRSLILPKIKYKREVLQLSDGGQVALDWLEPAGGCAPDTACLIVLPGLTGTSHAEYVKGLALAAFRAKIRSVVFNNRGIGLELKTPRTYCASNTEDLHDVIQHIRSKYPDAPIGGVGVSMGGLILGNYMASRGKEGCDQLAAAMLISVPWDVFKGTESIERPGINLMLNNHLASCLTGVVHDLREMLRTKGPWVLEEVMKARTIREFDSRFTSKAFGYKDVDDYYSHATLHNKLHNIHVPTLCISAGDDPFQPFNAIPIENAQKVENLAILVTSHGGHIGFMEGFWPFNRDQYMFRVCEQFFKAILPSGAYKNFGAKVIDKPNGDHHA